MKTSSMPFAMATLGTMFATSATLSAQAMPLYTPSDHIFGQHASIANLEPEVVFGYLYTCASDSAVAAELVGDCTFKNYIQAQFPAPAFGDLCTAPSIEYDDIVAKLQDARSLCPDDDDTSSVELSALAILQVFESESCWASLCEEGTYLHIESHFVETCVGVELPYPASDHESSAPDDKKAQDDALLTCMLDQAMNTPARQFGLTQSSLQCWPPGHNVVSPVCDDVLATPVYNTCRKIVFDDDFLNDDMFSMSMDMQVGTLNDEGDEDSMALRERFCSTIRSLVLQKGLLCLATLCTDTSAPTPSPSTSPSDTLTLSPSTAPSDTPTLSPSTVPSDTPTLSPSTAPSPSPSNSPSALPTLDRVEKVVDVELAAGFSLDVAASASDLPELVNDVLEGSIKDSLMSADFGNITVSVTKIAGNPVRRRLQTSVPLEFMVQVTDECHYPADSCDSFARNLIDALDSVLESAVADGSLTSFIQDQAKLKSADKLETASVIASSYRMIRSDHELKEPMTVATQATTTTSASACLSSVLTNLVMLAVPVLLCT